MVVRALLFDFDGTLANSLPALVRVYRNFVIALDGQPSDEEFDSLNGPPLEEVVRLLCDRHQRRASSPDDIEHYHKLVDREFLGIRPFDGVKEMLGQANSMGLRIAIVTSNSRERVSKWLESHGLMDLVEVVIGGNDVEYPKPSPQAYLSALARLGIAPSDALVIEDGDAGILAARLANIPAIRFDPGHSNPSRDVASVAKMSEVIPLIETLCDRH